jgi:hypothetical protein
MTNISRLQNKFYFQKKIFIFEGCSQFDISDIFSACESRFVRSGLTTSNKNPPPLRLVSKEQYSLQKKRILPSD